MALRPLTKITVILIVIVAGIAVTMATRSRFLLRRQAEENRFVTTYLAMAIAKEKYIGDPDSLKMTLSEIFKRNGTDSTWMADYGRKLSLNLPRSKHVWADITAGLERLKRGSRSDSLISDYQSNP